MERQSASTAEKILKLKQEKEFVEEDPSMLDAAGEEYHQLDAPCEGNYADAISCYNEVLRIDPSAADGLVNRGNTYKEIGRVTEAIQDYIRAITVRPTMAEAHANLASAYKDRYWTSVHYNPQASIAQMDKLETSAGLPASASASHPFCIDVPDQTTLISSMNNRLISGVDCAYQRNLSDGGEDTESSKFLEDGKANSGLVPDIDHVTSGAVSSAGLDLVCVDVESNGALSESSQISLLKQPSAHQTPVTADNSLREQRILEHIQCAIFQECEFEIVDSGPPCVLRVSITRPNV
ncbi:Probable UDP-N-acetylglucosamine--peptide N-acetylglucosaminyltransferase SEC [Linum perenne]